MAARVHCIHPHVHLSRFFRHGQRRSFLTIGHGQPILPLRNTTGVLNVLTPSPFENDKLHLSLRRHYSSDENKKKGLYASYLNYLEKNFPLIYKLHVTFVGGTQQFIKDSKKYRQLKKELKNGDTTLDTMQWENIYLLKQLGKDQLKVGSIIAFSLLPFAFYVVLPMVYFFPRQLLSFHFHNPEQRVKFMKVEHQQRAVFYRPLLQTLLQMALKNHHTDLVTVCQKRLAGDEVGMDSLQLASNQLALEPQYWEALNRHHLSQLCQVNLVWSPLMVLAPSSVLKYRLLKNAELTQCIDKAIDRSNQINSLTEDQLRRLCFERGAAGTDEKRGELDSWLGHWINLSKLSSRASGIVHYPVLLGPITPP